VSTEPTDRGPERAIDERLADWVDGCMSPRDRDRFEAELRVNAQLRADLEEYERTVATVRAALQAPTRRVDLADRVLAAIAAGGSAAVPHRRRSPRTLLLSLVAAAALLAVAVLLNRWPAGAPAELRSNDVASAAAPAPTGGAATPAAPELRDAGSEVASRPPATSEAKRAAGEAGPPAPPEPEPEAKQAAGAPAGEPAEEKDRLRLGAARDRQQPEPRAATAGNEQPKPGTKVAEPPPAAGAGEPAADEFAGRDGAVRAEARAHDDEAAAVAEDVRKGVALPKAPGSDARSVPMLPMLVVTAPAEPRPSRGAGAAPGARPAERKGEAGAGERVSKSVDAEAAAARLEAFVRAQLAAGVGAAAAAPPSSAALRFVALPAEATPGDGLATGAERRGRSAPRLWLVEGPKADIEALLRGLGELARGNAIGLRTLEVAAPSGTASPGTVDTDASLQQGVPGAGALGHQRVVLRFEPR
jgi:hypothetical protein